MAFNFSVEVIDFFFWIDFVIFLNKCLMYVLILQSHVDSLSNFNQETFKLSLYHHSNEQVRVNDSADVTLSLITRSRVDSLRKFNSLLFRDCRFDAISNDLKCILLITHSLVRSSRLKF